MTPKGSRPQLWIILVTVLIGIFLGIPVHAHNLPFLKTQNPQSQAFFDQGLAYYYGFNFEQAITMFETGIQQDPKCSLCYWGIGLALGSEYDTPISDSNQYQTEIVLRQSLDLATQDLTDDLAHILSLRDRDPLAYAQAMRDLYQRYPNYADIGTLAAEASLREGSLSISQTLLEQVLEQDPRHLGAHHLYIHLLEDSPHPEKALASAEFLDKHPQGSGHLQHMPSHIYMQMGSYQDAYRVNQAAIQLDHLISNGIPTSPTPSRYALTYYLHHWHFLIASLVALGQLDAAWESSLKLVDGIPVQAYEIAPGLQELSTLPLVIKMLQADWSALLDYPQPTRPYEIAIWHWGRGLAWAHQGNRWAATKSLQNLQQAQLTLGDLHLHSSIPAHEVLTFAVETLRAQLNPESPLESGPAPELPPHPPQAPLATGSKWGATPSPPRADRSPLDVRRWIETWARWHQTSETPTAEYLAVATPLAPESPPG